MTTVLSGEKKKLLDLLSGLILNDEAIAFEDLSTKAHGMAPFIAPSLSVPEVDDVVRRMTEMRQVVLDIGDGVVDESTFVPWLDQRKVNVDPVRWDAYKHLLVQREWSPGVIARLDNQTDKIVELMGNPQRPGEWKRRGLAIGEVQSGKTATYIGILNKAIDYGYKIIVVIGGHTEDLRRQTQKRIDTDLTGIDSSYILDNVVSGSHAMRVGVGLNTAFQTNVLTTTRTDFRAANKSAGVVALGGTDATPTVFVIKKNVSVLANLTTYLAGQGKNGQLAAPLVVIDDEADWASVNTKSEDDIAAVNKAIRNLLATSRKSSYMAITATPFANILIDDEVEEDLFPRDFIQALESPSNYFGVAEFFGSSTSPLVTTDVEDGLQAWPFSHKKSHRVVALPESLLRAVSTFLVGTSLRRLRVEASMPASMMVNISRYNDVQAQAHDLLQDHMQALAEAVKAEFGLAESAAGVSELTRRLRDAFLDLRSASAHPADLDTDWEVVRSDLVRVVPDTVVELVNGQTMAQRNKTLNEMSREDRAAFQARPKIFVGGDVLARGLTLEGLQVSYFVRRAGAADTLLQMGRWFGYRPDYGDLVRIWMDQDVVDLFKYVANVSDDLRGSLREMNALSMTPKQFGLRIRRHPDAFMITAANKQKHGTTVVGDINIHGSKFESWALSGVPADMRRNLDAARELASSVLQSGVKVEGRRSDVWTTEARIAERFFSTFKGHDSEMFFGSASSGNQRAQLAAYLSDARNSEHWDVSFVNGLGPEVALVPGMTVKSSVRRQMSIKSDLVALRNRRVAAGNDLRNALPTAAWKILEDDLPAGKSLSEQRLIREVLARPLLLVFTITSGESTQTGEHAEAALRDPVVASLVAFPASTLADEVDENRTRDAKFVANKVFMRAQFGMPLDDEDNEIEDWEL